MKYIEQNILGGYILFPSFLPSLPPFLLSSLLPWPLAFTLCLLCMYVHMYVWSVCFSLPQMGLIWHGKCCQFLVILANRKEWYYHLFPLFLLVAVLSLLFLLPISFTRCLSYTVASCYLKTGHFSKRLVTSTNTQVEREFRLSYNFEASNTFNCYSILSSSCVWI